MPKINLGETTADGKRRYRYLQSYVDRHGGKRTYLRRAGMVGIPLPEPEEPGFDEAYQKALRAEPPPMIRRVSRALTNRRPRIGVYLLIHKGQLTYIGSSKNMVARIAEHRANGRPFDQAFYISTTESERLPLEKLLIKNLEPKENRVGKTGADQVRLLGRNIRVIV